MPTGTSGKAAKLIPQRSTIANAYNADSGANYAISSELRVDNGDLLEGLLSCHVPIALRFSFPLRHQAERIETLPILFVFCNFSLRTTLLLTTTSISHHPLVNVSVCNVCIWCLRVVCI